MPRLITFCFQFICLLGLLLPVGELNAADNEDSVSSELDWSDYSKQLDQAEKRLSKYPDKTEILNKISEEALSAIKFANGCIGLNETQLAKIVESIDSLGAVNPHHEDLNEPRQKLEADKFEIEKVLAQCRLLELRANDIQEQSRLAGQALIQKHLFAKEPSVIDYISGIFQNPEKIGQESTQIWNTFPQLPVNLPNAYLALAYGAMGMLVGLFWSIYKRREYHRNAPELVKTSPALATVWNSTIRVAPSLLLFGLINLSFHFYPPEPEEIYTIRNLATILLASTISYAILRAMLRPRSRLHGFSPLIPTTSKKLFFWGKLLLFTTLLSVILLTSRLEGNDVNNLIGLTIITLATLSGLAMMRVFWLLRKHLGGISHWYLHLVGISVILVAIVALWTGYANFSALLFRGAFGTVFILLIGWLLIRIPIEIFDSLDEGSSHWQQKLRHKMGLHVKQIVPGLIWLRLVHILVTGGVIIISLLMLWGMSESSFNLMLSHISNGYEIGGFTLEPLRILNGILMLAVLILLTQFLKRSLAQSWLRRTNLSRGAREATVTITGYTGVAFATFVGLSVAGINFSNLAIIAGALSVGIGFGLQNIVNNFISGLILLFERPIRRGDWVKVGVSEGYVKNISIRSTVIQTFDRSDIIVPNSELISNQVTNMMLNNQFGRIIIPIRVAYGSDTEQVMEVLRTVAEKHPAILLENNEPQIQVLFRSFGDSAMNFELRCHITEVEWMLVITSELNLAIDKAFREAGIKIPPPRQVVQIVRPEGDMSLGS